MTANARDRKLDAALIRGGIGSALLLLGGLIIEKFPAGWAALLADPFQLVGSSIPGRLIGQFAFVGGVALLAHAWLALVAADVPTTVRTQYVRRAVWTWVLPLLIAPPLFSHDAWSYVAQGALVDAGVDPYNNGPGSMPNAFTHMVDAVWRYTGTPYGPIPLTYGALLTHVVSDVYLAMLFMRVQVFLALVLLFWALPRLARQLREDVSIVLALALASPFTMTQGIAGMHNDLLVAGIVACALAISAGRRRHGQWIGCALVGLAAAIKFTAIVAVVPVLLLALPVGVSWWRRFAHMAAGGLLAATVVVLAGAPYGLWVGWVRALDVPGKIVSVTSPPTAVGMLIEHALGGGDPSLALAAVPMARTVGMALAMAIVLVIAMVAPTGDLRSALRSGAWIFAAVIALGPVFHTWYLFLVLPFVAPISTRGRALLAALSLTALLGFVAPLDSSLKGALLLIVITVALAVVLFAVYLWRLRTIACVRTR